MLKSTKILIAEHDLSDLDILQNELTKSGINYTSKIVANERDFRDALVSYAPDIILCDFNFPAFDGLSAFKLKEQLGPGIPFILVSGVIGEEKAVELIKSGVTDYALKDRLFTLPGKIDRALRDAEISREKIMTSDLLLANEKKFRHTLDNMLEGIQIHDFNFKYLYVNDTLVKSSTYTREELIGFTLMERYPGIEESDLFKSIQRCMHDRIPERIETKFTFPNGTQTDFELSLEPIPEGISILSIDRTEQNRAKEKLEKVNRLYAFNSAINQSIVHISDEQELLDNVCKIAVGIGQFKLTWISLINEQTGKLNMVSLKGSEEITQTAAKYSRMDYNDLAQGGTPTGRVLSTGELAVSNNLQNDLSMLPWQKQIIENGIKAGMSLPIKKFGKLVGVYGLFAGTENFFDAEEIALLKEATDDISFALENFEKAKKHKEIEELLLKNETRYRVLIEKSADIKALSDENGNFIYTSPALTNILGYSQKEIIGSNVFDFIHPNDKEAFLVTRKKILETAGIPFDVQIRLKHKNGRWTWCEGTITNMFNIDGVKALVSNFRDISERKMMEEQRVFEENNLNALINNTADLMWSVDRDFNLITSNEPFEAMSKVNFGRILSKGENILSAASSPEMHENFKLLYERAFSGETFTKTEHFDFPFEFWTEISYYPIRKGNEIIGTACHSRDITEAKLAERNLQKSEAFNSGILNSLSSHIAVVNAEGNIVAVNESWKRFALENGETTLVSTGEGANYYEVCEKSARDGVTEAVDVLVGIRDVLLGNKSVFYLEYPCHSPNEKRWFGMRALKFQSDEPMVVVAHQNITERKLAEENLVQSEAKLNEAQAIAHLGNWELDFETQETVWSAEACRIYGIPAEKSRQSQSVWISYIHPEDLSGVMNSLNEAQRTLSDITLDYRILLKDGSIKYLYVISKFKFDQEGKPLGLYGIVMDVTDRKLAEAEREKMVSNIVQHSKNLEQFASIVSHNLRAPVAHILGLANVLNHDISLEDKERSQQFLFEATRQLDETFKDLNKILQVRSEISEYKELVLFQDVVDIIESSIRNLIKAESVQIITNFSAKDSIITIKSYLHSIFYNLISNSIKYKKQNEKPVIKIETSISQEKVTISFSDNGLGIDLVKHSDKMFRLYNRFHLKIEGKGLGLFMVKTQVESLGGTINVKSAEGVGTEFVIELPL